jgi:type I restriction enzyme R subunit
VNRFNESIVEEAALAWLESLGWRIVHGPDIAPDTPGAERGHYGEVVLGQRLRGALVRLNPGLSADALEDAFRKLTRTEHQTLVVQNHRFHRFLVDGVAVEYQREDGSIGGAQVRVLDFDDLNNNDWLAVNQFTVVENRNNRRPDVVLFVNGLPLVVMELKNAAAEHADVDAAFRQLQTYKREIPSLLHYNAALVVSDGVQARIGTLTAGREWFKPWRTIAGATLADERMPQIQVLLEGVFEQRRFLDLLRYFIVFERTGDDEPVKKMAGYHQFHAVNAALGETLRAAKLQRAAEERGRYEAGMQPGGDVGDRRIGVVWHTQGSGKSLTMAFYAGRAIQAPEMENPTVVVITDRNDLDDQLFATFAGCGDLLRQPPMQAADRVDLREKLRVEAGGVVFTTIQKFMPAERGSDHPVLSNRRNIVVIADEAHRSQYDFIDGFARHMRDALPNASFIGFTGTPIELDDKSTKAVFGDYISVYDIQRAVEDGATVPIYYESRLAQLELSGEARPRLDEDFEEATEGEEVEQREKLKSKWAQLEALVGAEQRIQNVANDIVRHFEERLQAMDGKGMIVCMSRRICVELYEAIIALRPDWRGDGDDEGVLKVVMTGSASDPLNWQPHVRNKARREQLALRFKDPQGSFKLVIVRDMWLTGFDAPCLHTMYIDKPMRGHGLMQAIARVNRVFRDKPGGLVVDYLGLAHEIKRALVTYTESGGTGRTAIDQKEAVAIMLEKYEICCGLFHGFDRSAWRGQSPQARLSLLPAAQEHVLALDDGKKRLQQVVSELSKAFALSVPAPDAERIRDDVGFFQAVRAVLAKNIGDDQRRPDEVEHAIRQILSRAVASNQVVDIFAAAGLQKPDISILSDQFLAEVRGMPQRNLAVDLLQKLLKGEIKTRGQRNLVQARAFSEMLEHSVRRYANRAIEAAQVIEELIGLAKEMRAANARGEQLHLTEDELAFYDALETNDSAVKVLGDTTLRDIACELVETVRDNVTIDWTMRENVRAHLRVLVKRILRKYGYPPDKQEKATQTVLEQAALLSREWAMA